MYKRQGLDYRRDDMNNMVVFKPASKGYEDHAPLMLEAHMDMVDVYKRQVLIVNYKIIY